MRLLRPLRLLVPLVAVGGALVIFLVFGFLAYQGGTGGGAGLVPGYCDAGLRSITQSGSRAAVGDTAATLNDEQRQNAATIIGVARQKGAPPRAWLVAMLITLWGARLSWHIFRRNHGKGEDPRYQAMRAAHGHAFWWRSLFTVFWLQGAILWFVALPLLVAVRASSPAALTAVDGLGVLLFAVGFGFEVVGDYQLERFRAEPSNRGKVLDRGLWRYTRHPNYFGNATLWWGLYAIAAATPSGWLTVLSPALMTFLLMRVSGVTLLEDGLKASKPGYHAYITRTPTFFPWFPRVPR